MSVPVPTKPCGYCHRGLVYKGCPDALGTEAEECDVCGGSQRVVDVEALESMKHYEDLRYEVLLERVA
jgi:hypothetical protein